MAFLRRHPLSLALIVQAALLLPRLDLLPLWDDERFTLQTAARPWGGIVEAVRVDVHPPLYYVLVRAWLALPFPGGELVRARLFSALATLAVTAVFYHLWLRRLGWRRQILFLGLWVSSPCLVLYGRMARSYSLQVLAATLAIRFALDWLNDDRSRCREAGFAAAATLLLYIHYLPGLAVLAAVAALALWRRQWRALRPLIWIGLAYLPWIAVLAHSAGLVAAARPYWLGGNWVVENLLKLAYAFVAFQFGETAPVWGVVLGAALIPFAGVALVRAWRAGRHPPVLFVLLAGAGYFVAASWVSFAFVGARLLFLLPFYYLFLLRGLDTGRRAGVVVYAALLVLATGGLTSYYRRQDFLNKGYLVDFEAVARRVHQQSGGQTAYILLDRFSTSAGYSLHGPNIPYLKVLGSPEAGREARERLLRDRPGLVWYVRYTRPSGASEEVLAHLERDYVPTRHGFVSYSRLDRWVMARLAFPGPPEYLLEAIEFRRHPVSR